MAAAMEDSKPYDAGEPIREAVTWCSEAIADLQHALDGLSKRTDGNLIDERSFTAFTRAWRTVCKRRRRVELLFRDLDDAVEDIYDSVEADKALKEPGEPVPWEQVKADLGLA